MHHGLEHGLLSELTVLLLEVRNLHFVGGILLLVGGILLLEVGNLHFVGGILLLEKGKKLFFG